MSLVGNVGTLLQRLEVVAVAGVDNLDTLLLFSIARRA